jgi:Bardet-Biedl syndrome 7 protein
MTTLNLERSDLLQLDPISSKGTLKLLPLGKKNKQKLLIGDDSGQLSCFEFKKGEPQIVFQTKVFEGPVSCICLGGNPQKRDKIFLSHSQRIVGLTKKGKEFFKLTSTLTEPIRKIVVEDTRIWTGCENIYNLFDDGKDAAYFISRGQINDLLVANVTRDVDFDTVLGCQDKFIRIIRTSQLFAEIPTDFPVTSLGFLQLERDLSTLSARKPSFVLFGTARGTLGIIQVNTDGSHELLWEIDDDEKRNCINCINVYDINKDGVAEIIIGRDDGRIEVFKIQPDNVLAEPVRIFCKDIGESVRSIESGIVNTPDYPEILVAAYSGKLISFTTEPLRSRAADDAYGRSIQTVNNENRIKSLRKETEDMKKQLEKAREKLKKLQPSGSSSSPAALSNVRSPIDFPVNSQFELDTLHAAYTLNIELQSPIDLLVIRSPVVLDLVESDNSSSVLSITPPNLQPGGEEGGGKFMAVFRCQNAERRLSLNLRTNEGEFGELVVTIVAAMNPKAAKVVKYELKPMSLHTRVHLLSDAEMSRPRHRLRYTGKLNDCLYVRCLFFLFVLVSERLEVSPSCEIL